MAQIWQNTMNRSVDLLGGFLPTLLGALAILVVGWVVALVASSLVRNGLKRTTFDNRIAQWVTGGKPIEIERYAASVVFWLLMLFVVMAVFQTLNLGSVTEPVNALLNEVATFLPRIGGAGLLLLLAWVVATVLQRIVGGALRAVNLDGRLGVDAGVSGEAAGGSAAGAASAMSVSDSLANVVYWLVFLLFLPAVLGALALEGLLSPVQSLVDELLGFLPDLLGASLILVVGWFIANLVRRIVTNLLVAVGADAFADRIGVGTALGSRRLSSFVGLLVYVLILLPVLIAALNALALDAVTAPASQMLADILTAIPLLFGAAILVGIAFFVGKVVAALVTTLLQGAGFDGIFEKLGVKRATAAPTGPQPSQMAGTLIIVTLMLFASIEAAEMLGFGVLAQLLSQFLVLGGHVVFGLVIFGVGLFLASVAHRAVLATATPQAGLLATAARVSIVVLAGAMSLRQMGLANEIVNLAVGWLFGAIAVAAALAFGLGARDVAGKTVERWSESLKNQ
jgi:hypothetical protein